MRVLHTLSGIYGDIADHATSERLLQRARSALPDDPTDPDDIAALIETLTRLGNAARLQGHYEQAEQHLTRALAIAGSHPGRAVAAIGARNTLAITFKDSGRYAEAAGLYRDVLAAVTRFSADSAAAATAYHNLAGLAYATGDYQSAEQLARHAVQLRAQRAGADHQDVAADLAVLAAVLLAEHNLDEAQQRYRQALRIYTRVFGDDHYEVAVVLNGLATIAVERGRPTAAAPLYRRALAIKERVLGPDHPEIGVLLNNLAVMHRQAGQLDEALTHYGRALPLLQRTLGDQHPTVMTCADNLAALTHETARPRLLPVAVSLPLDHRVADLADRSGPTKLGD